MDLEAATRDFVAALGRADTAALGALVSDGAVFEVAGWPGRYSARKALAIVAKRGRAMPLAVTAVQVKRNVAFAQLHLGDAEGPDGVLVLSWDQDLKVAHGTLHANVLAWRAKMD